MIRNLALALLLSACQGNYLVLHTADAPTAQTLVGLRKDVNEALGCKVISDRFQADEKDEAGNPISRRSVSVIRDTKLLRTYDKKCVGFYDSINDDIIYEESSGDEYSGPRRYVILIHELGHAMGLDHHAGTVMNPTLMMEIEGKERVMHEDEALASLQELVNRHGLNPCNNHKEL